MRIDEQQPWINNYWLDGIHIAHDDYYHVPVQIGEGLYLNSLDRRRFQVVDIWYSDDKHGRSASGVTSSSRRSSALRVMFCEPHFPITLHRSCKNDRKISLVAVIGLQVTRQPALRSEAIRAPSTRRAWGEHDLSYQRPS